MRTSFSQLLAAATFLALAHGTLAAERKLVLIAGRPSHPPGMHEFRAGSLLLQKCLAGVPGLQTTVATNGWPTDESVFQGADAVVIYADGGNGHPAIQGEHLRQLTTLVNKGVGFGVMHYGCEIPADRGGSEFKAWIGGYYEDKFSCNPIWKPSFQAFPSHPIARGVQPFVAEDEWYFNMRFREDPQGIVHVLVARPSDAVRDGPYVWPKGPYPHIQAAKGRDETMLWAVERPDGGRGFGFTGGHFHKNWGEEQFRKVVLNALVWVAKAEVPAGGVPSQVSGDELQKNLDVKK